MGRGRGRCWGRGWIRVRRRVQVRVRFRVRVRVRVRFRTSWEHPSSSTAEGMSSAKGAELSSWAWFGLG